MRSRILYTYHFVEMKRKTPVVALGILYGTACMFQNYKTIRIKSPTSYWPGNVADTATINNSSPNKETNDSVSAVFPERNKEKH